MELLHLLAVAPLVLLAQCVSAASIGSTGLQNATRSASFSVRDLHDCIAGRSEVSYVQQQGEVTVFSKPFNLTDDIDGPDSDPNVADCVEHFDSADGYSWQRWNQLDVLPEGNLAPDSNFVPYMLCASGTSQMLAAINATLPALDKRAGQIYARVTKYSGQVCSWAFHVPPVAIPGPTDCINPTRPSTTFRALSVDNGPCMRIFLKLYVHHSCRLWAAGQRGNRSAYKYPTVRSIQAGAVDECVNNISPRSYCLTVGRYDQCAPHPTMTHEQCSA